MDPGWVQAGAESGLLVLAVVALVRDGLQAKRANARAAQAEARRLAAERETVTVAVEAKADQDTLADRVQKVQTAEQATELAQTIRQLTPIEQWYEGATGIQTLSAEETASRRERADQVGADAARAILLKNGGLRAGSLASAYSASGAMDRRSLRRSSTKAEKEVKRLAEQYGLDATLAEVRDAEAARAEAAKGLEEKQSS